MTMAVLALALLAGISPLRAPQAPAAAAPAFEAVTIKPAAPPDMRNRTLMIGTKLDPVRFTASNQSLRQLIVDAYELKPYQVLGPDWLDRQRFDVVGVSAAPANREQMMAMLRTALEASFQLKTHRENKVLATYQLEVAAGGSKLKPPGPGGMKLPSRAENGPRLNGGALKPGQFMMAMQPGAIRLMAYSGMADFAAQLGRQLDRPMVDATGLTGVYAIELTCAPPPGMARMMAGMPKGPRPGAPAQAPDAAPPAQAPDAAPPAPSIFTAVEQQLGLKLVPAKAPVEILVVDGATQVPQGN